MSLKLLLTSSIVYAELKTTHTLCWGVYMYCMNTLCICICVLYEHIIYRHTYLYNDICNKDVYLHMHNKCMCIYMINSIVIYYLKIISVRYSTMYNTNLYCLQMHTYIFFNWSLCPMQGVIMSFSHLTDEEIEAQRVMVTLQWDVIEMVQNWNIDMRWF